MLESAPRMELRKAGQDFGAQPRVNLNGGKPMSNLSSAPGSDALPLSERQFFIQQFEKDLAVLELFFLLLNRTCPIRNLDLVWADHGPQARSGRQHVGIDQALDSNCSRLLRCVKVNPHPEFCNLINDFGKREAETCALSDGAAEQVVRRTGKSHVYRCHFGLLDIAVPVMVHGRHVATLFSGQILPEPPDDAKFQRIAGDVAHLRHINLVKLREAYRQAPVVSEEDILNVTELLEAFAEFLANSWVRLGDAVREQRRRSRETGLAAKELAYLALQGGAASRRNVEELLAALSLDECPNRVLLVKPESEEDYEAGGRVFDLGWTSAIQTVEEHCEKVDNAVAVHLRGAGICVFFNDGSRSNRETGGLAAHRLAHDILQALARKCDVRVRVGIGGVKTDWLSLAESYREALMALAGSETAIAHFRPAKVAPDEMLALSDSVCRALEQRDWDEANRATARYAAATQRNAADALTARMLFWSALNSVDSTVRKLGVDELAVTRIRNEFAAKLAAAPESGELEDVYLRYASAFLQCARSAFTGRGFKLVDRARRFVDNALETTPLGGGVSVTEAARAAGCSRSHLSRLFKKETGNTFEEYMIRKRVQIGQRLLLDPNKTVAQVAEMIGFSDPSYFARVFRKVAGCSPTEFVTDPQRTSTTAPKRTQKSLQRSAE
jgi:AraC-like DNA-binding protein/ligand-binding sensor protein